jgi:DNA-binding PadR family transcriptional regulator
MPMPIHHAVLGLLAEGPSHGYELRASFEKAIGPQWGELKVGHLYQVLDRLARDGLVSRKTLPQTGRPDRVVHRLTKPGREELDRWLHEPYVRQAGYRDDFFLKLFVASRRGIEPLKDILRVQREFCLSELAALAKQRRTYKEDPLITLLIEAAILHTKASLKVVEAADARAAELVSSASVETVAENATSATDRRQSAV